MKIINIIWKEFRQNIRNFKANAMMVLFPIVLIIILGAALSGNFENSVQFDDTRVLYTVESENGLSAYFKEFTSHLRELGIEFEETEDINAGINSVKDTTYVCYILLEEESGKVSFYKNARYNFEAGFVENLVNAFVQKYNVITEVAKSNPAALEKAMAQTDASYVSTVSLDAKKLPRSIDYYSVTMITLIVMYASMTGLYGIKGEQNMKTGNRMLCSPVRKYEILTGKVLGGILVTIVQLLLVIIFSRYVLKAYWGSDITTVMLLLISQAIMAISIGTGVAYLIPNEGAASGVINTLIPVMVLFGGGYVPLEVMGDVMQKLSVISPIKWINTALFRVIYDGDYSPVATSLAINMAIAAIFIVAAAVFSSKEAGLS